MPRVSSSNMNCADNNMKILTISTLYPNPLQPQHGIFVETRMRKLKQRYPELDITVIAPCPSRSMLVRHSDSILPEMRNGIRVFHPAYLTVPLLGMYLNPFTLYHSIKAQFKQLLAQGERFDVIDAHYIYPDTVAASWLAQEFNLPLVATARGSDIHLLPDYRIPRWQIKRTLAKVDTAIGVCSDLVTRMQRLQPKLQHSLVIRNGVDLELFYPIAARDQLRDQLGYTNFAILCVGRLVELKGLHKVIDAIQSIDDVTLTLIGDGPQKTALQQQINRLGLQGRVRILAPLAQAALREHYNAADCLVLASSREGWANVLLEAMACGCPVISTPAGGSPEVVAAQSGGIVTDGFSTEAIKAAITQLRQHYPSREAVHSYAKNLSWQQSIELLKTTFDRYADKTQACQHD